MSSKKYFSTLLKKAKRLYPSVCLISLLLLLIILTFAALILHSYENSQDKIRYKIGLVGETENRYLDVGLVALKELDSSRFSIDIIKMTESEAKQGVLNGTLIGYIYIPDELLKYMGKDVNSTAYFVSKHDTNSFGSMITRELVDYVSEITLKSQDAILTIGDISSELGAKERKKSLRESEELFITRAITRQEMSETEIIGVSNSLSMGGYYVCGAIILFLLLWGISCCDMLFNDNISVQRLLYGNNIGAIKQSICEYSVYLISTVLMLFMIFTVGGIAGGAFDIGIEELSDIGVLPAWKFLISCIPVIVMFTSFQFLLYECIRSRVAVILLQFFIAMVLGYASGCFFPSHFFPKSLQLFAEYLPVGAGFSYVKGTLAYQISGNSALLTVLYTVLFLTLIIVVRRHRLEGDK